METWIQRVTLAAVTVAAFTPFNSSAESISDLGLTPELDRRQVKLANIDTENFEVGISGGLLSVEDFETNPVAIAQLTYHVTEDFFVQARYGSSEVGQSSFDRLSGAASLLGENDRDLTFYDLSVGVNVFPGEAFLLDKWAVNSSFYIVGGAGNTDFAGSERFTVNAGLGYRMIANDFIAFNFSVRDHVFDTELTGSKKATHNIEIGAGLSIFF